jgi:hypothetical protein
MLTPFLTSTPHPPAFGCLFDTRKHLKRRKLLVVVYFSLKKKKDVCGIRKKEAESLVLILSLQLVVLCGSIHLVIIGVSVLVNILSVQFDRLVYLTLAVF